MRAAFHVRPFESSHDTHLIILERNSIGRRRLSGTNCGDRQKQRDVVISHELILPENPTMLRYEANVPVLLVCVAAGMCQKGFSDVKDVRLENGVPVITPR